MAGVHYEQVHVTRAVPQRPQVKHVQVLTAQVEPSLANNTLTYWFSGTESENTKKVPKMGLK